jgi:hypothetical protein
VQSDIGLHSAAHSSVRFSPSGSIRDILPYFKLVCRKLLTSDACSLELLSSLRSITVLSNPSQWPCNLRVGLQPLPCWDCGFESYRGHGCLSFVSVVCCQVQVSASGSATVQRSPVGCHVSECYHEASTVMRPWPTRACHAMNNKKYYIQGR